MSNKTNMLLTYKGKPLVRCGNTLYYGDLNDPYVVMLQVVHAKTWNDIEMADKVLVQLMLTDPEARAKDRFLKKSEKDGLYNALDIGAIWLSRALAEQQGKTEQEGRG